MMKLSTLLMTIATSTAVASTAFAHGGGAIDHGHSSAQYVAQPGDDAAAARAKAEAHARHDEYHRRMNDAQALDNARLINGEDKVAANARRSAEHARFHELESQRLAQQLAAIRNPVPVGPSRYDRDYRDSRDTRDVRYGRYDRQYERSDDRRSYDLLAEQRAHTRASDLEARRYEAENRARLRAMANNGRARVYLGVRF